MATKENAVSKDERIRRLRLGDIRRVLHRRYRGYELPGGDDAALEDLELLLDVVSLSPAHDVPRRMKNQIELWAPWMDTAQSYELVEAVLRKPPYLRKIKKWDLGQKLNLTFLERQALGIRTIDPADLTPEEFADKRKDRRKTKERERKRRARRKAGIKPRIAYRATSLAHLKPWAALGISRRTWERRRKRGATRVASVGAYKLLDRMRTDLRHSACGEAEGLPRKAVALKRKGKETAA